jgi:diaminopimelate decarboxylase
MTVNRTEKLSQLNEFHLLLEQNDPLLPKKELFSFVQQFFLDKDRYLNCLNGCQTPVYLLDSGVLRERSRQFQDAFREHLGNMAFYFAVKSNNHPDVAGTLLQTGIGLDVSSGQELEMAVKLNARDVVFSGPGKTDGELEFAVKEADRLVVLIDSFNELNRLGKIAASNNRNVRVGVRLNTNSAGLWRKFGILPEELHLFWEMVSGYDHLQFQGLQFHSSWNHTPKIQIDFIQSLGKIISQLPVQAKKQIQFLDIGGGFWPSQGEWLQEAGTAAGIRRKAFGLNPGNNKKHYRLPVFSIEMFAEQLSLALKEHILTIVPSCKICCEPGRWICNDAMHLLLTVVDKKGADLVITDGGTNSVGWERFETDYFPVLNLSSPALEEKQCSVLGALCTPHDIWGYNYWGEDILPGDVLMIPCQGAYTYSLRQNFIKPLPAVISI